jgi:predicted nucleotidyltransferase
MPRIFFPLSRARFLDREKVIGELKIIAQRLTNRNKKIEEIYLFGSYASGTAGLRSDADILIILSDDNRKMRERLGDFILEFVDAPVPVDVLVYTKDEITRAIDEGSQFLKRAKSGIRL